MYFMSLINESDKGSTHGDHIIIGMWRKNNCFFWKWFCPFRPMGIIGVWFAPRPTGDSMLQIVENLNVDLVCRPVFGYDITHAVFHVFMVGQFKHGLFYFLTKPYHCFADQPVVPIDAVKHPWRFHSHQFRGCGFIKYYQTVV